MVRIFTGSLKTNPTATIWQFETLLFERRPARYFLFKTFLVLPVAKDLILVVPSVCLSLLQFVSLFFVQQF